jgi:alanine racemase
MSQSPYRSWAEISRSRIAENYRKVRAAVGPAVEVMGVVKADAYGHGAIEVSRVLVAEGAAWLAVSNVGEGVSLRQAGVGTRILVMAECLPFEHESLIRHELTPVVHGLEQLAELDQFAGARGVELAYHLKLDTGMGRLGTRAEAVKILEAIRYCRHTRLEGLMTHFASSADYTSSQTDRQIEAFQTIFEALREAGITPPWVHMSSTNPVAYGRSHAWGNMVRAGLSLYGYVSPAKGNAPQRILEVQPVLSWKAAILAVKELPVGTLVGYGGTFRTERPTRIAMLAAGYADGVSRRLSNRGKVIAGGRLAPVVGAVSMDLTTIDITGIPGLEPGDAVTLLGREGRVELDAEQIARWAGTISYAVLCGISARVSRVYL